MQLTRMHLGRVAYPKPSANRVSLTLTVRYYDCKLLSQPNQHFNMFSFNCQEVPFSFQEEEASAKEELWKHKKESSEKDITPRLLLARKQVDFSSESVIPLLATIPLSDIAPPPIPKSQDLSDRLTLMEKRHFLPIHFFDDTEYDTR